MAKKLGFYVEYIQAMNLWKMLSNLLGQSFLEKSNIS